MSISDESHSDETSSAIPDPEATIADTSAMNDPKGASDDVLDATVNISYEMTCAWEESLDADVGPGQTIKVSQSGCDEPDISMLPKIPLKRRDVCQQDESDENSAADYQIEELLGEGGMGAVYAGRQQSMDRPVAIKVLKPGVAQFVGSERAFVSEAIITGGLDHPNIVPIYDVGKQSNDDLFYAMKQVVGVEWKARFKENSIDENLDMLLRVSDAIAFAHARGIIHRDLKPANIMLGSFGEVLVMDWGLAMLTEDHPRRASFPAPTPGGTPNYMSPEMLGATQDIDRRSDVYLLGGILFKIVTGKSPHTLDAPPANKREQVTACLEAVAKNVIASTDKTGELIDIARKALSTDPADRYQTVPEFQAALRDYLSHEESIELAARAAERLAVARQSGAYDEFSRARFGFETALEEWPDNVRAFEGLKETRFDYARTAFDRGDLDLALSLIDDTDSGHAALGTSIQKAIVQRDARQQQIRRLRRITLVASLVVALVSIVAVVWINTERGKALTAQQEEAAQRKVAEHNEKEAKEQRQVAIAEREKALVAQKEEAAQREKAMAAEAEAKRGFKIAERNAYYSDMLLLRQSWGEAKLGEIGNLLGRYSERDDLRSFEWSYWDRLTHADGFTLDEFNSSVKYPRFSPDGTRLAVGNYNMVKLWDVATMREVLVLKGHNDRVNQVSFSLDGSRLASASDDKTVKVWDAVTGKEILTFKGHTSVVTDVAFRSDGTQLASASNDKTVKIWDAITGQEIRTFRGHTDRVRGVSFSPDGTQLVSTSADKTIKVWDAETGEVTLVIKIKGIMMGGFAISFSPDGTRLVSSDGATIKLWDAVTGKETLSLKGHASYVEGVSFSRDGTKLASASWDQTVKVWDATTGEEIQTFKGHTNRVNDVSFSPDGTRLASTGNDRIIKVWNMAEDQESIIAKRKESLRCVSFSPDGSRLASADWSRSVIVWDAAAGQKILKISGARCGAVGSVSFSPDGTRVATAADEGTLKVWDATNGQEILNLTGHKGRVTSVLFSPDGTQVVSAGADATVRIWDATTGEALYTLKGHTDLVRGIAFNAEGTRLASYSFDKTVKLWDTITWQETLTLPKHGHLIFAVCFMPHESQLVVGDNSGKIVVWDTVSGRQVQAFVGHTNRVDALAFSSDGKRLVSASNDGMVKMWDTSTLQETLTLRKTNHESHVQVKDLSFCSDEPHLAAVFNDGTLKIWDARPWTPELKAQAQARGYLTIMRDRMKSLEALQTYIRDDKTINDLIRKQALDWAELFWKNRSHKEKAGKGSKS